MRWAVPPSNGAPLRKAEVALVLLGMHDPPDEEEEEEDEDDEDDAGEAGDGGGAGGDGGGGEGGDGEGGGDGGGGDGGGGKGGGRAGGWGKGEGGGGGGGVGGAKGGRAEGSEREGAKVRTVPPPPRAPPAESSAEWIVAWSGGSPAEEGASGSATLRGLQPGCTYACRVRLSSRVGAGAWSDTLTLQTLSGKMPTPALPTVVAKTSTTMQLRWRIEQNGGGAAGAAGDEGAAAAAGRLAAVNRLRWELQMDEGVRVCYNSDGKHASKGSLEGASYGSDASSAPPPESHRRSFVAATRPPPTKTGQGHCMLPRLPPMPQPPTYTASPSRVPRMAVRTPLQRGMRTPRGLATPDALVRNLDVATPVAAESVAVGEDEVPEELAEVDPWGNALGSLGPFGLALPLGASEGELSEELPPEEVLENGHAGGHVSDEVEEEDGWCSDEEDVYGALGDTVGGSARPASGLSEMDEARYIYVYIYIHIYIYI